MDWKNLLGSFSESVNDELRLRIQYLTAENRILRQQVQGRVQLSDSNRKTLGEIGHQLGRKALAEIATVAQPDTILAWHRTFADKQVDISTPPKWVLPRHVPLRQLQRAWLLDVMVHLVRWVCWATRIVRSRSPRFGKGLRLDRLCVLASRDHREDLLQDGGKVVIMPAVAQRPMRDGPVHRHYQLAGRRSCHDRLAA